MELTAEQARAVNSNASHIIVAAAAGSGKTKTLTERIGRLLRDGVDPTGIVAITFTRMAAEEMKERLSNIPGTSEAFIGTIHAFAHKVLKVSGDNFTILSDDVDMQLHQYLIETYCKHLRYLEYLKYRDVEAKVDMGILDAIRLEGILTPQAKGELHKLHGRNTDNLPFDPDYPETIETLCEQRNIIGFDELLRRTMVYFSSINADIQHVLVDEFQDIGTLQYNFIASLHAHNYFYVGDDYQAIYGWNGGNVDLFKDLMQSEGWEQHMLTQNWRSASKIIEEAGVIIEQVPDRIDKKIQVMRKDAEGEVVWGAFEDIKNLIPEIKRTRKYGDWFILTRSNKELQEVVNILKAKGVPHIAFRRAGLSLGDVRKDLARNTVKVMTAHMAKGLEAPNVLLYSKSFHRRAPSYRNQAEERRVLYVGMTRARDTLVILNR